MVKELDILPMIAHDVAVEIGYYNKTRAINSPSDNDVCGRIEDKLYNFNAFVQRYLGYAISLTYDADKEVNPHIGKIIGVSIKALTDEDKERVRRD